MSEQIYLKSTRGIGLVVAILLLAAATRIINAGHYPVWTDEGWSLWAASEPQLVLEKVAQDRHPPLYFLALSGWQTVAGNSHIASRFLSIAAGILSTVVVYRIGMDWFGRSAGLYAAGLFAVLSPAVYYAQEVRHYSWLVLSVCLMSLFFLRYLRHPHLRLLIPYILSVLFMLYTLYFGLFVLMIQGVIGLFVWRGSFRHKRDLVAAWVVAAVLYIPWLLVIQRQMSSLLGGSGIGGFPGSYVTTLDNVLQLTDMFFGGQVALLLGIYLLAGWQIVRRRGKPPAHLYILLWGGGLFVAMFAVNLWLGLVSARTLVYLTPALMLVCGYGFTLLTPPVRRVLGGMAIVFMLLTPGIIQPRLDSHQAALALAADYSPGDLVILETGWDDHAFHYEVRQALPDAEIIRTLPWVRVATTTPVVPQVEADLQAHRRVWVVNWFQPPQVIPYLDEGGAGFQRVLTREVSIGAQYEALFDDPNTRLVLFERPDSTSPPKLFGDLFALHDALLPTSIRRGEALHVDLWWSALTPPPLDYSVGVFLLDEAGVTRAEHNVPPGSQPTSEWARDSFMFDRHTLLLPGDLPPGSYSVVVNMYWYGDQQPLPVDGEDYAMVGQLEVVE